MKIKIAVVIITLFLSFAYVFAQDFIMLSAKELKNMIDKKTRMVLVDARELVEYREGHIPTAINIPPDKVSVITTLLPKNKKTLLIFYCRGVG